MTAFSQQWQLTRRPLTSFIIHNAKATKQHRSGEVDREKVSGGAGRGRELREEGFIMVEDGQQEAGAGRGEGEGWTE